MTAPKPLQLAGHEDVVIFQDYSYGTARIGVTIDNRAVYDFDEMVTWLVEGEGFTTSQAVEWIDHSVHAIALDAGPKVPVVVYSL